MKKLIKRIIKRFLKVKKVPIMVPVDKDQILKGKVALITGGSSGIGFSIAKAFLSSGAKVILVGSNENRLKSVVVKLNHTNVMAIPINVKDVQSIPSKINLALKLFPENRIDILVNSAGVHHTLSFENMTEEEYDQIMDVNLKGTFFMCQTVCKYMKQNRIKGHILNISSSSALRPATGPYHISKHAITAFTKGLAKIYQPYGIVVNAIAPGQTATPMLGKDDTEDISNDYAIAGRYIMPEEIASLATIMVSDMGNMIVGDTFYITGGSAIITYNG